MLSRILHVEGGCPGTRVLVPDRQPRGRLPGEPRILKYPQYRLYCTVIVLYSTLLYCTILQYRLCPADQALSEDCFQKMPLEFVGQQGFVWADGTDHWVAQRC